MGRSARPLVDPGNPRRSLSGPPSHFLEVSLVPGPRKVPSLYSLPCSTFPLRLEEQPGRTSSQCQLP